MIGSNDRPDNFVIGNSKAIINYGISELVADDGSISYTYEAMEYPATDTTVLARARAKLEVQHTKKIKLVEIEKIVVTTDSVDYTAHTRARSDMTGVIALANHAFNEALVSFMPELQPLYDAVYKSTIRWKGDDNTVRDVHIAGIAEAGTAAMNEYARVIGAA